MQPLAFMWYLHTLLNVLNRLNALANFNCKSPQHKYDPFPYFTILHHVHDVIRFKDLCSCAMFQLKISFIANDALNINPRTQRRIYKIETLRWETFVFYLSLQHSAARFYHLSEFEIWQLFMFISYLCRE